MPSSLSRRLQSRRPGRVLLAAVAIAVLSPMLSPAAGVAAADGGATGRLSGLVQTIAGKPFAAADVTLTVPGSGGAVAAAGRSNGDGRYDVSVPDGIYDLTVAAPVADGELRANVDDVVVSGDTAANVVIVGVPRPSAKLSGTVRDGAGRPAPLTTISAAGTTVTGPDGRFDMDMPKGDGYTLSVRRPVPGGRIMLDADGFDLSADRNLDVVVPTVTLTVRVRDGAGRPVAGVWAGAWSEQWCDPCTGALAGLRTQRRTAVRLLTDSEGIARLQVLPADTTRVVVEHPRAFDVRQEIKVTGDTELAMTFGGWVGGSDPRFADAAAPPGAATLQGTARTADGAPIDGEDAEVRLVADDVVKARSWLNDDGSYSISAPPGRYTLVVDGPPDEPDGWEPGDFVEQDSYLVAVRDVDLSADRQLDLTLPASPVSLRVLDPSGVPVPYARVESTTTDNDFTVAPGLSGSGRLTSRWHTDADGIARVLVFAGAPAAVSIDPPGGRGLSGSITVPAGTTGTYDTRLEWGPTLRGHMRTPDGQPMEFSPGYLGGEDLAFGPDGTYAVTVEPGTYSLELGGPDVFYRPSESVRWESLTTDPIEVTADRTLDLTIPMTRRTVVTGIDVGGRPAGEFGNRFSGSSFEPITVAPGIQAHTSFGMWEPGSWEVSTDLPILSPTAIEGDLWLGDEDYEIKGVRVLPGEPTYFAAAYGTRLPTPDAPRAQAAPGATPGSIALTWAVPDSDQPILAYLLVPDEDYSAAAWVAPSATSGELRGLVPGFHRVQVFALSRYGLGAAFELEATASGGSLPPQEGPGGSINPPVGTSGTANPSATGSGYWLLADDGGVSAFGAAADLSGAVSLPAGVKAVDLEPTPARDGYWILAGDGTVHPAGAAPALGDVNRRLATGERPTSLSATPTGRGYWVFTDRGRVVPFGDAASFGDMSGTRLNGPVLDSIATPTGRGYYLVASDGGIFAFGDAAFKGSMGGTRLNAPVRSLVPDPDGSGYWLVASDGGVFAFDAGFRGSMGGTRLNRPVTGMVPYGSGYLMVAEDGGVFTFSDLAFAGSLARSQSRPIVSVASAAVSAG